MMNESNFINDLQKILIKKGYTVSDLQMTSGNYDSNSTLILDKVPTITTDFCEIGCYDKTCYFVIVLKSDYFTFNLFNSISSFPEVKIYGYENSLTDYYPTEDFDYFELEKQIKSENLMQIQFDFNINKISPKMAANDYVAILSIFEELDISVINQLSKMSD